MDEKRVFNILLYDELCALDRLLWGLVSLLLLWRLLSKAILLYELLALVDRVYYMDSLSSVHSNRLEYPEVFPAFREAAGFILLELDSRKVTHG